MNRAWLVLFFPLLFPLLSATADDANADLNAYIEIVEKLKAAPVDRQLDILRKFLDEHPETRFRNEIESNVRRLEELATQTDPVKRREAQDADRYLRAVDFAKKLTPEDQIALWEQFIEENPKSLYRKEAESNLAEVKAKHHRAAPATAPPTSPTSQNVVPPPPAKDRQTGVLLATFVGIIVPGMGHWYAHDWALAGAFTGVRLAGLGVGVPGLVQENYPMIIIGSILYGISYFGDIIDTPFAVDRYNETKTSSVLIGPTDGWTNWSIAFRF